MKKENILEMPAFLSKRFGIVLLLVVRACSGLLAIKHVFTNNQSCMVKVMLSDLTPDKLHYYLIIISLHRCDRSCNKHKNCTIPQLHKHESSC